MILSDSAPLLLQPAQVLAKAGKEENVVVLAEIETEQAEEFRNALPLIRDRRPELY